MDQKENSRLNELFGIWLQSIENLAQTPDGLKKFKEIEMKTSKRWLEESGFKFEKTNDPYKAVQDCANFLIKTFNQLEIKVSKGAEVINVESIGTNPFYDVYTKTQKSGMNTYSFLGGNFTTAIQESTGQKFRTELKHFDSKKESIILLPSVIGLKVTISLRLTKGTIRISQFDMKDLGLSLIDKATITHEKTGNKLIALSYSSSKVPRGSIQMSIADSKLIGYKGGDKVIVEKASTQEKEELIDVGEYEYVPTQEENKNKLGD